VLDRRRVVGGMKREDDRCPVCHGRDRTRLIMLYLAEHGGLDRPGVRLLHIAPDLSLYLWLRRKSGLKYTASDIDAARYRHISNTVTADLTNAPFPDAAFDLVICSHVLEHVPDDRKAMSELLRILAPGGRALLLVPFATDGGGTDEDPSVTEPADRERRFGQWDHVRLYDRDGFVQRLGEVGFEVSIFAPFDTLPDQAHELGLNPLEVLPVARRPGS
jgi:SAM-dependent methyltransferase